MLLSARILVNVTDVNSWEYSLDTNFTQGDANFIYFQLIDQNKDKNTQEFRPSGKRFVPASGATLQTTIGSIDNAFRLVKIATQPFPGDSSIWRIQITATDPVKSGKYALTLELNETGNITRGVTPNSIVVRSLTNVLI